MLLQRRFEERAAEIVERHRVDELAADRWHVVEQWLALLPATARQERPELLLAEACVEYCRFRIDRIAAIVETVGPLLEGRPVEASLGGELAFYRGMLEYWMGEGGRSRQLLEDALPGLIGRHPYIEPEAELSLALARGMVGRGDEAIQALQDRIHDAGDSVDLIAQDDVLDVTPTFSLQGKLTAAAAAATGLRNGIPVAYRAGAKLRDVELVQFHPTTLYVAGATRSLISEAVRGEGGLLVDRQGNRFMPDYDPKAELAPRDVVARDTHREMRETGADMKTKYKETARGGLAVNVLEVPVNIIEC